MKEVSMAVVSPMLNILILPDFQHPMKHCTTQYSLALSLLNLWRWEEGRPERLEILRDKPKKSRSSRLQLH